MNKSRCLVLLFVMATQARAQSQPSGLVDAALVGELQHNFFTLALFGLLAAVIVSVLKLLLNNRLKGRLLDTGAPESVITLLLTSPAHPRPEAAGVVKWIALLTAAGVGLTIGAFYPPWGIHSLIILVFSLAIGLLGYYFFLKRSAN